MNYLAGVVRIIHDVMPIIKSSFLGAKIAFSLDIFPLFAYILSEKSKKHPFRSAPERKQEVHYD